MSPNLSGYLDRLYATIHSRHEIVVAEFELYYPDLPGFPEHKHESDKVLSAPAPDLSQVLRETDGYLYPDTKIDQQGSAFENLV